MAKLSVKKGDNVMVITGKDQGKVGKVLKVVPETGRIYVEGVNIISKSKKPRNAQEKGGIIKQEGTIDASNVMHVCAGCGDVVRVKHEVKDPLAYAPRGVRLWTRRNHLQRKWQKRLQKRKQKSPQIRRTDKSEVISWQKRKIRLLKQLQPIRRMLVMLKDIA